MQDVLSRNRKVVGGDGRQLIYVPMPASGAASQSPASSAMPPAEALLPAIESSPEPARSGVRDPVRTGREEPTR